ncbi:hypothetical protein [Bradyrhizobium sp. CCBAU 53338]|uniref:hypothetical protein n=1 Tax=Bradyrhizobium sp. CCBAU 53338 TaxID=1325111 RepID=UPI00188A22E9|nr:hypothetical protein [Bradyrhizobium sp. CCBAU 53338]
MKRVEIDSQGKIILIAGEGLQSSASGNEWDAVTDAASVLAIVNLAEIVRRAVALFAVQ